MSVPFLSPILHWLQSDLRASGTSGDAELTAPGVQPIADYRGAGPPLGAAPHRYLFLVYQQPERFDAKKFGQLQEGQKAGIPKRVRYDLAGFVREAKLGEPVAGQWFVSN